MDSGPHRGSDVFDLYDIGAKIMRQNLRRRFLSETEEQIEKRLHAWLLERPSDGNGPGKTVTWPR